MRITRPALTTILALTASCNDPTPTFLKVDDPSLQVYFEPHFGAEIPIRGFTSFGFEHSAITLCQTLDGVCTLSIDPNTQAPLQCWLSFAPDRKLYERLDEKPDPDGGFRGRFIKGQGKITQVNGLLGHLGKYHCQVELTGLDSIHEHAPSEWGKRAKYLEPMAPRSYDVED
jgi:hypothetical protein